jgi:cysteine desulfurase / selenocysteine lyase
LSRTSPIPLAPRSEAISFPAEARKNFPFLERRVNGKPIVYLDNAATTQKPKAMLDSLQRLYCSGIANVHRAVNFLADEVTQEFEAVRESVSRFIGAQAREIVFVNNSTHGINLIARALSRKRPIRVLTTTLEHHSNLLPWANCGAVDFIPWDDTGRIDLDAFVRKLAARPDLVAIARASNFLGTLQPVQAVAAECRKAGVPLLVDASQSIAHEHHDVSDLDCDFLVFSGHKIYGPSGIGVLYIRNSILEQLDPVFLGGSMVKEVHATSYVPADLPGRFEPGTPNIEGAIALAAALDYFSGLDHDALTAHEAGLIQYAKAALSRISHIQLLGPKPGDPCAPLTSFLIKGLESSAVAKTLGFRANVIVRSGFLCAQPAHDQLGCGPSVRASFGLYNTTEEIDLMIEVLQSLVRFLL